MLKNTFTLALLGAACTVLTGCLPVLGVSSIVTTTTTTSTTTTTGGGGGSKPPAGPPIQVTAISPSSDLTSGGALVTITGSGFVGVSAVIVKPTGASAPTASAPVMSVSATQLVFTAPAFAAGLVDIDITRTDGTTARLVQSFLYYVVPTLPAPTLASITPTAGAAGTVVTLTGTNFTPGATITIGAEPADLVSLASTSAVVIVRPGAGGAQAVTLTNPDTQSATLAGAFMRNGAPVVTVNLPAGAQAIPGDVFSFTVSATDPEGDPMSLRLVDPPPGMYMAGVAGSGTQQATVRWHVRPESAGVQTFTFQAQDWQTGRNVGAATAVVQVAAAQSRAATLVGDVTGDGIPDIVSGSHRANGGRGAVYVWSGATGAGGAPIATLNDPAAAVGDSLGLTNGQGIFLRDITGDAIDDIIVLAPWADANGVPDSGAVYVWIGGALLTGQPMPNAVLTIPNAVAGDRLGEGHGRSIRFGDVTGDGSIDLIVAAHLADRGGVNDAGAVFVWSGGVQIVLATAPLATLTGATPLASDQIGGAPGGQTAQTNDGLLLEELTGDAILDIVAIGSANGGAVYVWAGSASLAGSVPPTATARAGGAWPSSTLGLGTGQGVICRDVTGDRVNDLLVLAEDTDVSGAADAGAIFVWQGGPGFTGAPLPTSVCVSATPLLNDRIGRAAGAGLRCQDVTGDGIPDLIAAAEGADLGGVTDVGVLYVWNGGLGMTGTRPAAVTLASATRTAGDRLGNAAGLGWHLADTTGDGVLDVIAGSRDADTAVTDAGRICVWAGGGTLWGNPAPLATCEVPGAAAGDRLGTSGNRGILLADVDGDRILDIVAGSPSAANGSTAGAGAVYAWFGGGNLSGTVAPVVTFVHNAGAAGDAIGSGGIHAIDLNGDGQAELIAAAPQSDPAGAADAGGFAIWSYAVGTGGTVTAKAFARRSSPSAGDRVGGGAVAFADLDNDGTLDLLCLADGVDVNGATDAGVLYLWSGQALLAGTTAPAAGFGAASPVALDAWGASASRPLLVADTDGDGVVDALVTAPLADAGTITDAGSLHRVGGGTGVANSGAAQSFAVPSAGTGDLLGE